jgi:hypothetical protein
LSTAVIDLDFVKYSVAAVGEKRSVLVTHKESGRTKGFSNKTEFLGRSKKVIGGWLGELNKSREEQGQPTFSVDDFEIKQQQEVDEPLENVLHSAKLVVESAIKASGASKVVYVLGEGDSFRVERSTLLKYKDNRTDMLKPLLLNDVTEYLKKKYNPIIARVQEADDVIVQLTYRKKGHFILGLDKDYYGSGSKFFNINKPEEGIVDTDCFGKLYLKDDKVRGYGRMFKYIQCISEDGSDNYKANCFSETKWAEKSAYKALKDCTNDVEAFEVMMNVFKKLYPEPKKVIGWRGDPIIINWLYCFQELMDMCHLHRWENDFINVVEVLSKMEINYD